MKRWIKNLFHKTNEPSHLKTGRWGEKLAVRYLKKSRHRIIGERVRVGKRDELDIISESNNTLVFTEVKTRKDERYGRPFSAVNKAKQKNISRAAVMYLKYNNIKPDYIRFDVVEVIGNPGDAAPEIRHIENAFPLDSAYRLWF